MNFTEDDIITTDGYLNFCKDNNICYIKTDFFYIGTFMWRNELHPKKIDSNVVIGHSDYEITDYISQSFTKVFCINKNTKNPNTFSLPLGITNDCNDSDMHKIYGNKEIMVKISKESISKDNLLYLNFNVNTYKDRQMLYNKFKEFNNIKIGNIENTIQGREKFLREIKASKFVLCPRGNGIDTHRLWETLYMGSIPIVKYEITHDNILDLPILFINDWNEITEEFLNKKYEEFVNKFWCLDKLKINYWYNYIKENL